jgi:hypothetical protein
MLGAFTRAERETRALRAPVLGKQLSANSFSANGFSANSAEKQLDRRNRISLF